MAQRGRPRKDATDVATNVENKTDQQEEGNVMPQAEQEVQVKTKGTRPGWKPSSQLPHLKAPAGFCAKWCAPAKLTERRAEGWQIMKPSDNVGEEIVNVDVNDVGSLTGALRYRDLVAIMLPKELKKQRDEYLRNENNEAMKGVLRKTDGELKDGGVETYTPKGLDGRVVIN